MCGHPTKAWHLQQKISDIVFLLIISVGNDRLVNKSLGGCIDQQKDHDHQF